MKWLKDWSIFENSSDDIVRTVKEILLELNDIGLQTKVTYNTDKFLTSTINVTIYKYDLLNSEFGDGGYMRYQISDVIDTIFRLNTYLTDSNYKPSSIYVIFQGKSYSYTLDELKDDIDSEVNYISLEFDK